MAKFIVLTDLDDQKHAFNIDRISLHEQISYTLPGHYVAYNGKLLRWTIIREEGQPDYHIMESMGEIIKAARAIR